MSPHVDNLISAASLVGKAWSESWLGYHSLVYYRDFESPPAGAIFSAEWGFEQLHSRPTTVGDWEIYAYDEVINVITEHAGDPDLDEILSKSKAAKEEFDEAKANALSILSVHLSNHENDSFISDIKSQIDSLSTHTRADIVRTLQPRGQLISRDSRALTQGFQNSTPHSS